MKRTSLSVFLSIQESIAACRSMAADPNFAHEDLPQGELRTACERTIALCDTFGFLASRATASRMIAQLDGSDAPLTVGNNIEFVAELEGRIRDEMGVLQIILLTRRESDLLDEPRKDWEEVIRRFPSTVEDVEETQNCFALARYAASVFHSLQIVEGCLIELGSFIGVQDPHSGWTAVSNRLATIMKTNYKDRTPFERENSAFLEQVQATVDVLKDAWRNKISHAQGRLYLLSSAFTPEIAEEILFATRAFSRRLATGLPSAAQV